MSVAESPLLARRLALTGVTWRGAVLALAVPFLFLHVRYQPGVEVALGSTKVGIEASDIAVLLIGAAALGAGLRRGFVPLRAALPMWIAAAALLVWIAIRAIDPFHLAHAVNAAKFCEYALLAPAVPLLLRERRDADLVLRALVLWSAAASTVGLLEFVGVRIFIAGAAGSRQASFLGFSDFAALSAAALLVGLVGLATGVERPSRGFVRLAVVAGGLGVVFASSIASVGGLVLAVLAVGAIVSARARSRLRPLGGVALIAVAVVLATVAIRSTDLGEFLRFVSADEQAQSQESRVETYAHRTLLAYIGLRIFQDHPIVGAGWQESTAPRTFSAYLPDARARFPDEPPAAFPSARHPWGIQSLYVQAAADLGAVGLLAFVAFFAVAVAGSLRVASARPRERTLALTGLAWILAAAVLWAAQGLVAGIPLDALTWLGVGLGVTSLEP